jgi:endonuclease YncB( thermonuclease family)
MMGKALFVAAGIALAGLGSQAAAEEAPVYRGSAEIVGPAMLIIGGTRIVLYGVGVPVKGQPCYAGDKIWDCATASAKTLLNLVGTQEIACGERRVDRFGRVFAVCKAGEVDLNRALVEAGMAVALPKETLDYVASEAAAKSKGVGIWRGPFTAPADYREMLAGHPQERRARANDAPPVRQCARVPRLLPTGAVDDLYRRVRVRDRVALRFVSVDDGTGPDAHLGVHLHSLCGDLGALPFRHPRHLA